MAYPTTLALFTALWSGSGRTKSIALWSGTGGAMSALGSLQAGLLLGHFAWGSAFLITIPIAAAGLVLALLLVPTHVNETTEPVDNLGGIISIFFVRQRHARNPLYDLKIAGRRPFRVAYAAGIIAIIVGAGVVFFFFPRKDDELRLHAEYRTADG